ncbi:MAG TPA: branched-chain amino acid ABC transporter permease [Lichenihabitans sp.]|jgi:branched-chain amino acid transport system permease protein|nr:branched-chain amino acid ABC transporter permease [Lichenihabitans sp.]
MSISAAPAGRGAAAALRRRLARLTLADVVLWTLRVLLLALVVAGTVGTILKGRYGAAQWVDFVVFGLTIGSIYAQIALGYTMVYGVLRLINFAHGDIMMAGTFSGYFVARAFDDSGFLGAHPVAAVLCILAVSIAVSTGAAVLAERVAYRAFRHVRGLAPLITAIGVSFFIEQTFRGLFGSGVKSYPDLPWQNASVMLYGFSLPKNDLLVIGGAVLSMAVLYVVVHRTKIGTAIRAVSEDVEAAALMGIDANRIVVFTFMLGGAMAGIAGVFYAFLFKQVYFYMGFTPGIKAFAAAVLGGIGSVPGAMIGGLLLGIVETVGPTLFFDGIGLPAPYQLRDLIAFTILIMVLIFRPNGLLGERMAKQRA